MAQRTREVHDGQGRLLRTETYQIDDETANADAIRGNVGGVLAGLRAYIALPSPTAAQTAAAVKLLCRAVLGLARHLLGDFTGTE
jgi:hypothetical protein